MINSVSLFSAVGWVTAAGWEQLWNSSPNYGTDSGAFGQRLGAAAASRHLRGCLQQLSVRSTLSRRPALLRHGPGPPLLKAGLVYAGTRTIITRTDSGRTTPNFSLIAGNAGRLRPHHPLLSTAKHFLQRGNDHLRRFDWRFRTRLRRRRVHHRCAGGPSH